MWPFFCTRAEYRIQNGPAWHGYRLVRSKTLAPVGLLPIFLVCACTACFPLHRRLDARRCLESVRLAVNRCSILRCDACSDRIHATSETLFCPSLGPACPLYLLNQPPLATVRSDALPTAPQRHSGKLLRRGIGTSWRKPPVGKASLYHWLPPPPRPLLAGERGSERSRFGAGWR